MFGTILISIITVLHIYVFWRAASVPWLKSRVSAKVIIGTGAVLWASFFLGRTIEHHSTGPLAAAVELAGMNWMGSLFLIFITLLAMDCLTAFGFILRRLAPTLRGWALVAGAVLSIVAVIQGLRAPVVTTYHVHLPALPVSMENTTIVALSDLHLGSLIGERWMEKRIEQVREQKPDLVFLLGDLAEGHGGDQEAMMKTFNRLSAPLGVWGVYGNHEYHHRRGAGSNPPNHTGMPDNSGITFLRNRWTEISPGLVLAGVDDPRAWRRSGQKGDRLEKALDGRPPGATVLLSHRPEKAAEAARAGVGLMLSGHTHGGQIWPFDYLVRRMYPLLEGRYEKDGMTVIVCRGTGTWGPRMRLWAPGEIMRVVLHGAKN